MFKSPFFFLQVCSAAIELVGDLSRAVSGEIMVSMLDEIMAALNKIAFPIVNVPKSVKLHVFSVYGDIALAVGGVHFQKYLEPVLSNLLQASFVEVSIFR